ncbi:MAG: molybdopterin-dependent oxidoreductase, partial [Deltaproteobacteria bacterium]|nr:molybdopterin-dependent oxidoreductase [Deltaproteobacteria bacterium]
NIVNRSQIIRGDVERGFAESDHIFEDTFRTQVQHHAYIEPHACVAEVDPKGRVTVWTCNQMPFVVRAQLGEVLQLPLSRVHVIGTRIGGAFGGKCGIMVEPAAVLLARKARRPVKIVVSYEEEFAAGFPRHACTIWMKTGVKQDGTLVARDIRMVYDTGAYANFGPLCTGNCATLVMGPYKIPNVRVDAYCVYTNKSIASTLRSPGGPQATFAYESQMDMIAERLGLDPVALRLQNAVADGDEWPTGQHLDKVELRRTLEEAVRVAGWAEARRRGGARGGGDGRFVRGIGLAVGTWRNGTYSTGAWVRMNEDGTVLVGAGAMDLGTGTETVLAQVTAEELGLGMDQIEVMTADTDLTPYDFGAVGSRTTYVASRAVRAAAAQVRQQLLQLAAAELEARVEDLEAREGAIRVKGSPAKAVALGKLAGIAHKLKGGPLMGEGNFMGQAPHVDYQRLKSHPTPYLFNPTFATQVAEVEVDRETGNVRVLRLISVNDIGFAVNPGGVAAQIEGGVAQGIGYALMEEVKYDRGRVLNGNFMTYLIPTAPDIPRVEHRLVETLADQGIDGVKGIGEPPIIPTAAAIANAIYHATGVRLRELPATPERVAMALRQAQSGRR